jgi:hypothetical protein
MFSILHLVSNFSSYKLYIPYILVFIFLLFSFLYINNLKNKILFRDNNIISLNKNIENLKSDIIKNKLVYQINEKTLNDNILDQNNKIQIMKVDEAKNLAKFNKDNTIVQKIYFDKILEVRDSNSSNILECNILQKIIDEELK